MSSENSAFTTTESSTVGNNHSSKMTCIITERKIGAICPDTQGSRAPSVATSKQRSMSVTVNPRVEYIDRASDGNSHGSGKDMEKPLISGGDKRSTFQRSSSLQVSMMSEKRPKIPTGNMLTESLMAAAAEEKRRKKSVSASIRYLAAEKKRFQDLPFYIVLALLILMTLAFLALLIIHFQEIGKGCQQQSSPGPRNGSLITNNTVLTEAM